jgi:hypothetical protein
MDMNYDPLNMSHEETRAWSSHVVGLLEENSESSRKEASLSMTDYLRPSNYEASFAAKILTPGGFDQSEIVPALNHDQPQIFIEIEPDSAGAQAVDFGSLAETFYPYGKRAAMTFQRVQTQRIVKDVTELGSYRYNFRTVLTDLLSLKLAFLRDARLLAATDKCISTVNTVLPYTGKTNHTNAGADWSFHTWQRSLNVMRGQPNAIETATVLCSHLMIAYMKSQLVKDMPGTQIVVDIFRNGMSELNMEGDNVKIIASNKQTLVPVGRFYHYGPENQLGRYVQMIEPTMLVENRGLKVSFELYEMLGMMLINQAAISRTNYTIS